MKNHRVKRERNCGRACRLAERGEDEERRRRVGGIRREMMRKIELEERGKEKGMGMVEKEKKGRRWDFGEIKD